MTYQSTLIGNYNAVRLRLRNPPNAVPDHGLVIARPVSTKPDPTPVIPKKIAQPLPLPEKLPEVILPSVMVPTYVIIKEVAEWFGVRPNQISRHDRRHEFVFPRQIAFYLMSKHTVFPGKIGLAAIARKLGFDHTTLMHGRNKIARRIAASEPFSIVIKSLEDKIYAHKAAIAVSTLDQQAVEELRRRPSDKIEAISPVDISSGPIIPHPEAVAEPQDVAG